jgi:hypothetical protein
MRRSVPYLLFLFLFSCGVAVTDRAKRGEEEAGTGPFHVVRFVPGEGEPLPTSVTFFLSEAPHRGSLAALTHYNLNCGSETLTAQAVDSISGIASATVTLPELPGLPSGTLCRLALSPGILDTVGNRLSGNRIVNYVVP